ncbi:MAG: hypothetical protein ABJB76_00190 [Candidatus Nitrosocosmicus sp.]
MNTNDRLVTCSLFVVVIVYSGLLFGVFSVSDFFNNDSFAQKTVASLDSSILPANQKTVPFNTYENNEIGVSLKYPSNFLIDESKSNNTLKQISFYPVNDANLFPERYILWIDVFVQNLNSIPSLSSPSNFTSSSTSKSNIDIGNYVKNLVNSIQHGNKDVAIIEASANKSLSGYPAYKLITRSYFNNSQIDDVEIGTIVKNKLYHLNYQTESSNYPNSLPDANKIIQSFKIILPAAAAPLSPAAAAPSNQNLNLKQSNSNSNSTMFPILNNLLSTFKIDNLTNNSTKIFKSLKNSITNSVNNILTNSTNAINKSLIGSSLPPLPSTSSLQSPLSSLPPKTLEKVCSLPLISNLCDSANGGLNGINGNTIGINLKNNTGSAAVSNLTNESKSNNSLEKSHNDLFGLNNNNSGNSTAAAAGLNMSELNKLIGLFKVFSNSSSNSTQSPNFSSLFSNLFSTVTPTANTTHTTINSSENGNKNNSAVSNNDGLISGTTNQSDNNVTKDALKLLEFLQGIGR